MNEQLQNKAANIRAIATVIDARQGAMQAELTKLLMASEVDPAAVIGLGLQIHGADVVMQACKIIEAQLRERIAASP